MKTYRVTFSYAVNVEAESEDEAKEAAMVEFIDNGDYTYADVEVEEYEAKKIYG